MKLRVGQVLVSTVDATSVIVTRVPDDDVELTCGGAVMVTQGDQAAGAAGSASDQQAGTLLGKRYSDEAGSLELLCTKAGTGDLALGGEVLVVQGARPLPSSD